MLASETKAILSEYTKIQLNNHPDYRGDRFYNAEFFLRHTIAVLPNALQIAENIHENQDEASDLTELHPDWIRFIYKMILEGRQQAAQWR